MSDFDGLTISPDESIGIEFDDAISLFEDERKTQAKKDKVNKDGRLQVEQDSEEEMSELLKGFKDRAKKEDQRALDVGDSEFWIALCFQTREQKEEFLKKLNLIQYGDKYLDGMQVAKELGVTLESRIPPVYGTRPFDQEYIKISME